MDNLNIIEFGKNTLDVEINELIDLKNRLDESFSDAVRLLSDANKIIVSGVGKSGIIGKKIAATLSSVGSPAIFLHPVEALHGDIGIIQKGDVAILLSKSGSTEELVKILPYLKTRDIKIISITGNVSSYLSRHSDVILDASVTKEACIFNLAPTSSSTLAIALGDALAISLQKLNNITLEDFSKLHPLGQIGRNITMKVKDIMHQNIHLPVVSKNSPLRDAIIESTNKRMGCVCAVDENNILLGIITDGDFRRILQQNEDLRGLIVENVMTKNPVVINQESFLGMALNVMENRESEINVLPVVDENHILIGIIRLHDIVRSNI